VQTCCLNGDEIEVCRTRETEDFKGSQKTLRISQNVMEVPCFVTCICLIMINFVMLTVRQTV
jgi:hypothetical protein